MTSGVDLAGSFFLHFRSNAGEIQAILEPSSPPASADLVRAKDLLAILRRDISEATVYLPPYDQARYERQWKDLEKGIAATQPKDDLGGGARGGGKPKFAFKRNAKAGPSGTVADLGKDKLSMVNGVVGGYTLDRRGKAELDQARTSERPTPSTSHSITGQRNRHIVSPIIMSRNAADESTTISPPPQSYSLAIASISNCYIDLLPPHVSRATSRTEDVPDATSTTVRSHLTALYIKDIQDSVIVAPGIRGSVLVTNARDSLIVVGSQQFRMHTSTNCTVLLQIPSSPIIEHTTGVRFGAYPEAIGGTTIEAVSKHFEVLDFDWVRPGPSPNWSRWDGFRAGVEAGTGQDGDIGVWKIPDSGEEAVQSRIDGLLRRYGVRREM